MKKLFTLFAIAMMLLGVQNANAVVYTALSGSNWSHGSENPSALFDGAGGTKWGTSGSDADKPYVVFKTSRAIMPTSYRVLIANDTYNHTGRNWKSWRIYGGNFANDAAATKDATGWFLIDTKTGQALNTAQYTPVFLSLSETLSTSYSYFKIEIDALSGSWSDYCQMGDFAFIYPHSLSKDENNYYLINSAADLDDFSMVVNTGEPNAKGKLTADIDASAVTYTPIGQSSSKYTGTFDGGGHYIKLGINDTSRSQQGLFGYADGGANISNLIIKGSINGGANCAALICTATGSGTININKVGCEVNIYSTGNANAAFVGNDNGGSVQIIIRDSYNTGNISGTGENSAIGGWMRKNSQFTNVYNKGTVTNDRFAYFYSKDDNSTPSFINCYTTTSSAGNYSGPTTGITTIVSSGELCYKLNGSKNDGKTWTQTIGTDGHPVLFPASRTVHQYSASIYTNLPVSEGKIQIANSTDLKQFASEVNAGNAAIDAVLTGDINMFGESWPVPIGYWGSGYIMYGGHFNGQGHTINNLTYTTTQNYHGLFGVITTGALIENFNINGTITNPDYSQLGVVGFARDNNPTIRNVKSALNIINSKVDARIGGILGVAHTGTPTTVTIDRCTYSGTLNSNDNGGNGNYGGMIGYVQSSTDSKPVITNCLFDGTLTNTADTPGNCTFGGMVGYIGGGPYVTITNCLSVGTVTSPKAGKICGAIQSANSSVNNCYYNGGTANAIVANNPSISATSVSNAQVTKGEVAYKLNGDQSNIVWTQTIGTNENPTPLASPLSASLQVYQVVANTSYTNLGSKISTDKLQLETEAELTKFAAEVNAGNSSMNAELTNDIDLTDVSWTPIGTDTYKYYGTFDGGDNSITLAISTTESNQGLFGYAKGGATIRNLIVKGTVTCGASSAALIGQAGGSGTSGTITISRVGCEATVNGETADRIGAFVGNDWGHGTVLNIENSYNIGNITGSWLSSVVGCHLNAESTFTNVYNKGTISSNNFYTDAESGITCTNCYSTGSGNSGTDGLTTSYPSSKVTSGELCYKLGEAFYQALDTDDYPVLDSSKPNVYQIAVSDAGYASFVPEANIAAIPTGVTAYAGQKNGNYLHLEQVTELPADAAVIVKADEGTYYYNNTDDVKSLSVANDLTYSENAFSATGSEYCLANKGSGVGFYKVNAGVTIPARKVYLASGSEVKAFYFDDDPDAIVSPLGETEEGVIYNLAGQRISKLQRGINIINGKKVLK